MNSNLVTVTIADLWRGFTPDTTDEQARETFMRLYGVEPCRILRKPNIVLVGPVLAEQEAVQESNGSLIITPHSATKGD